MNNSLYLGISTLRQVYAKLLNGIIVVVTLLWLLLVCCQHSPFSLLSKPCSSNAFFNTLKKISDYIVKVLQRRNHISIFEHGNGVCEESRNPKRVLSGVELEGYVHM